MDRLIDALHRAASSWRWLMATAVLLMAATAPASARPCTSNCLTKGDYNLVVKQGGTYRSYRVHVPATYRSDASTALVLDMHGLFGVDQGQRGDSGQLAQSDKRGFIAVWPQGLDFSWNGYGCCFTSYDKNVDDVAFLRRVVSDLLVRANIDPARVYATGLSNGALMSHRLACEASDVFAAVAPVSFTRNDSNPANPRPYNCTPSRPVTVVEFHGTADDAVHYDGSKSSSGQTFQSAPDSLAAWAKTLGCNPLPTERRINDDMRVTTHSGCRGGVTTALVTVTGGVHNLYANAKNSHEFDIADYIWTNVFR